MKTPRLTAATVFRVHALYNASAALAVRGDIYIRRFGVVTPIAQRAYRAAGRLEWRAHTLMRESLSAHEQWVLIELHAADDRNRDVATARRSKAKAA